MRVNIIEYFIIIFVLLVHFKVIFDIAKGNQSYYVKLLLLDVGQIRSETLGYIKNSLILNFVSL